MSNLTYKGYTGTIVASIEDDCLHGQLLFIDDSITYEGNTVEGIKSSFEEAVDRYLAYCAETGKPANKPYSGSFNVRIGPELHRKAVKAAYDSGIKLNELVTQSIQVAIEQNGVFKVEHEHTHHHAISINESGKSATAVATMVQPSQWKALNAIN